MAALSTWDKARVELLRELWRQGLSASEIGIRLGCSRNAALAKAHRTGIADQHPRNGRQSAFSKTKIQAERRERARPQTPRAKPLAPKPHPPVVPVVVAADLPIPLEQRRTIQTLGPSDCRWPIGDPQHEDFHFCGAVRLPGVPYCEVHWKRAVQPLPVRQTSPAREAILKRA